jgi:hypothetical protein
MRLTPILLILAVPIPLAGQYPNVGDGSDGPLVVTETTVINEVRTHLRWSPENSGRLLTVASTAGFQASDEVMIHTVFDPAGTGGTYEFRALESVGDGTLTLAFPLLHPYPMTGTQRHQVIRVPHFTEVIVDSGGVLTVPAFGGINSPTGGVMVFRASGAVIVNSGGLINAYGRGHWGGQGDWNFLSSFVDGRTGGSPLGPPIMQSHGPNGGGGGWGQGGGGGGYGTGGEDGFYEGGDDYPPGQGGELYGDSLLTTLPLGSGGGGGHSLFVTPSFPYYSGDGGRGGGSIMIFANLIDISNGYLYCNGADGTIRGGHFTSGIGGGGGSGGSVHLAGNVVTAGAGQHIQALGGEGATGAGNGGVGRIRIDYLNSFTGTTNPPAYVWQIPTPGPERHGLTFQ